MRLAVAAALMGLSLASPAFAINVHECGENDPTSAMAIAMPWEKNTRVFYNGQVRVTLMDTGGEPVCCSMHLMILLPVHQDGMDDTSSCFMADNDGGVGFVGIDFAHIATRYDAGKGLLISFPYDVYNDGKPGRSGVGRVRVNVAKGTAVAE